MTSLVRSCLFSMLFLLPAISQADLRLDAPEKLLERASLGQNELRDVINELDQNLSEMRDVQTFDRYFYTLDALQSIADRTKLDEIYPNAVRRLGGRMVQKGVNWLDVVTSENDKILYYHRWMADTQPAFAFLYAADLRIKEEPALDKLKMAAEHLEAALLYADKRWPEERALRLLYRSTVSDLAVKALKRKGMDEQEALFWIGKVYTTENMSELTTFLQTSVFELKKETIQNIHWMLSRLDAINHQVIKPEFGASETLIGQIGDTAVDMIMKSFRYEEKLSDAEFDLAIRLLRARHLASLASAWAGLNKVSMSADFAGYYIQCAFTFIKLLESSGLHNEATTLSLVIQKKAAAILGRHYGLEGTWIMKDARGHKRRLIIIYASEDVVFASLTDDAIGDSRPYFHFIYDMIQGGFIATERVGDTDHSPNLPIRIMPQDDGTLEVFDPIASPFLPAMSATRKETYPDLLISGKSPANNQTPKAPTIDMNGTYEGTIHIPGGKSTQARLVVTVFDGYSIGNLRFLDGDVEATLNYGSDAQNGVIYLTHGNSTMRGTWFHLRAQIAADGSLHGYMIYGSYGLIAQEFTLKKKKR
jgi:hypothetical protein